MFCDSVTVSSCVSVCRDYPMLWCNIAIAVGTIGSVIVALFGAERICRIIKPSKLNLEIRELNTRRILFPQKKEARYFYLSAKNYRSSRVEKNVRVFLTGIARKNNGSFSMFTSYTVPLQMIWCPAEKSPSVIDIQNENTIDFFRLEEENGIFILKPLLYVYPNDFNDFLKSGDCVRLRLEIVADYYKKEQIFEIEFIQNANHSIIEDVGKDIVIKEIKK